MKSVLTAALAGALLIVPSMPGNAGDICGDLWVERNQIYKDNGYCFKTRDAIRYFGNAGCVYDEQEDVPLSARERREVSRLARLERRNGCN
jgi:hypothetical protein